MHKMRKSEAQVTRCFLQRFYSRNSTTLLSACYRNNGYSQISSRKEDHPQKNSWQLQIILIISIPWPQLQYILTRLPSSAASAKLDLLLYSFCLPSFLWRSHIAKRCILINTIFQWVYSDYIAAGHPNPVAIFFVFTSKLISYPRHRILCEQLQVNSFL